MELEGKVVAVDSRHSLHVANILCWVGMNWVSFYSSFGGAFFFRILPPSAIIMRV